MKKNDYLLYAIHNKLVHKREWFYTFFPILNDFTENDYLSAKNNIYEVKVNGNLEPLEGTKLNEPIFIITDPISVKKNDIANIESDMETTIGRLLLNYIAIARVFGNKIPYINEEFDSSKVESIIAKKLMDNTITVDEYNTFVNSTFFLCGMDRLFNISATERSIVPPEGIEKFKKELTAEYNKKYGEEWLRDKKLMVAYQEELKAKDKEWLKDDPTNGKLLGSKIKDNARVKMFLTFGPEAGFDKKSGKATMVENSLLESYPTDKKQLVAIFNSTRVGSFDRGHETQKGGAAAKELLRSSASIKIEPGDCGTKLTREVLITEDNYKSFATRYIVENGKTFIPEDLKKYVGKTVKFRSPMYCKASNSNFCSVCVGDSIAMNPNGVGSQLLAVSSILLTSSLKGMHTSQVKLTDIQLEDIIK